MAVPASVLAKSLSAEAQFGLYFDRFCVFSQDLLQDWHAPAPSDAALLSNVEITSRGDPSIEPLIAVLTRVANTPDATGEDRATYFGTLLNLYERLAGPSQKVLSDPETLFVGVEREGRILAERMGWLPADRSVRPHAKRIGYEGGLIVGLVGFPAQLPRVSRCVLVDGAIASGATTMAVMEQLRGVCRTFQLLTVHATFEGLRALVRYGRWAGLDLHIAVAHATEGMNAKYYAVDPSAGRLVVGDLGDTISDLDHAP